jgi:hypothetical protein
MHRGFFQSCLTTREGAPRKILPGILKDFARRRFSNYKNSIQSKNEPTVTETKLKVDETNALRLFDDPSAVDRNRDLARAGDEVYAMLKENRLRRCLYEDILHGERDGD